MGLGGLLLGAGAVLAVGAGISFLCDELSKSEIRRQDRMRNEYREYERRKHQEYRDTCRYYENARRESEYEYNRALAEYQAELVKKRKVQNKGTYDKMLVLFEEQYKEKEKLLHECQTIVQLCEKSIFKQQNTYVRFNSIKSTLISLEEAVYKLEAYIKYLDAYRKKLEYTYNESGNVIEPFSMTLPIDYPYEGKIVYLKKNEFINYGHTFHSGIYLMLDRSDSKNFDDSNDGVSLPFMVYASKNGRMYLSLTKGKIKNSIGGTIGIDAEVIKVFPNSLRLRFEGYDYLSINILKKDLLNIKRKTPIGSNLRVFVKDYDFALKKPINVSEKVSDGLSIAQFMDIILLQTQEEKRDLYEYLKKNDLLNEEDEWRIAPIYDDSNELVGVIMQIGYSYAYKAYFEEYGDKGTGLRYAGLLSKDELVSFDDVFVSTRVTVKCYNYDYVIQNLHEFEEDLEECRKLHMYLVGEFATQNKVMVNSPMNAYLSQWTEITNRLIDVLSYGAHRTVSVVEWSNFQLRGIGKYTMLMLDNSDEISRFVNKEKANKHKKFFIALDNDGLEKVDCKLIEEENGNIVLRLNCELDTETLIRNDFKLDMYSLAVPYAEKQHANAFSMFKEGRLVSEGIKAAIVNASAIKYLDNGYRIEALFNKKIQTNEKQLDAVIRAFSADKFFLIQGPPGTGKTTVIKELILQQLVRNSGSRILVVSQANVAVDNVLRGIVEISQQTSIVNTAQIVRCGTSEKIADDIVEYSFDGKYENYKNSLVTMHPSDEKVHELRKKWLNVIENRNNTDVVGECLLRCFQIIGATCVGLENRNYGLNGMEFDLVIIDEAGKALPGELLIPINHAQKVIIIGDHKQLPPVINPALYRGGKVQYDDVVEEEEQLDFLNRSFFQRLYEDSPDSCKCMLNIQFRMPPVIANLVNMFYGNSLETGDNCLKKSPMFFSNHLIFVDMKDEKDYFEYQETRNDGGKTSPCNEKEVQVALDVVAKIRQSYNKRIVIITPYKKQKAMIVKAIRKSGFDNVWVNTIDAFQGDEEDIVIYCTTRAKQKTQYFSDSARLNVAFSRARNTLIVIASSKYLKKYPKDHILNRISEYLEENAKIISYQEWISPDLIMDFNPNYSIDNLSKAYDEAAIDIEELGNTFFDNIVEDVKSIPSCSGCGVPLQEGENVLCKICIEKFEKYRCKCCGKEILFSFYEKYVENKKIPELCESCFEVECEECNKMFLIRNSAYEQFMARNNKVLCHICQQKYREIAVINICSNCGKDIPITYGNVVWARERGITLPSICKECKEIGNTEISIGICQVCGKSILMKKYLYDKLQGEANNTLHKECMNEIYTYQNCTTCGKTFSITFGEKNYLQQRGLVTPKRCKECRKNKW